MHLEVFFKDKVLIKWWRDWYQHFISMVGEFIFKFKLTKAKNDVSRVELLEFMETLEH